MLLVFTNGKGNIHLNHENIHYLYDYGSVVLGIPQITTSIN